MVEKFMDLLESRACEAEVHMMTRDNMIMFRCHKGVTEWGCWQSGRDWRLRCCRR